MKNFFQPKEQKHNKKGFTLIETIFAIFILVLSITGPMSAASNSLKASFLARDQIVAFYLAQDAIEYIKNYKDKNMIDNIVGNGNNKIIDQNLLSRCSNSPCDIDTTLGNFQNATLSNEVKLCQGGVCDPLYFDNINYKYTTSPSANELSKFTREIYIEEIVNNKEYKITAVVKWKPHFFSERRVLIQENVYNWLSL